MRGPWPKGWATSSCFAAVTTRPSKNWEMPTPCRSRNWTGLGSPESWGNWPSNAATSAGPATCSSRLALAGPAARGRACSPPGVSGAAGSGGPHPDASNISRPTPTEGADADFLAMGLYSRLAYNYWFERGKVPCAWAHFREMNLAERYPAGLELAQAYSEHAPVMTMAPWFGRGIRYVERSLAIRRAHGDLWGEGQSLHFYGVVLYGAGRFRECIDRCQAAVKIMERTGDRWEVNTANWHIAYCHYRLGDLKEAVEAARRLYREGLEIGDFQTAGIALSIWSKASGGKLSPAFIQDALRRQLGDVHTATEVTVAEGIRLLREGLPDAAADYFARADTLAKRKGMQQEYVAPVLPWLATVLRVQIEKLEPRKQAYSPGSCETLKVGRRALRVARRYRNNSPQLRFESSVTCRRCRDDSLRSPLSRLEPDRSGSARSQVRASRRHCSSGVESAAPRTGQAATRTCRRPGRP